MSRRLLDRLRRAYFTAAEVATVPSGRTISHHQGQIFLWVSNGFAHVGAFQ
jgi:hypothetical protein